MFRNAITNLDARRWFDRFQPQTVAIATWLLYIEGQFAVVNWLDGSGLQGAWSRSNPFGLLTLIAALSFIAGPYLMANGKLLGWWVSVMAAASPWILRAIVRFDYSGVTLRWVITQGDTIGFLFEAALLALLLHPMTRSFKDDRLR